MRAAAEGPLLVCRHRYGEAMAGGSSSWAVLCRTALKVLVTDHVMHLESVLSFLVISGLRSRGLLRSTSLLTRQVDMFFTHIRDSSVS